MRCYNGCPDSELQRLLDRKAELRASLPDGVRCTYFPMESQWQMFVGLHFVGVMFDDEIDCILNWKENNK